MVLALNVSVYFCKLLPLHMNGNLPVGIGMHVFAMICDLIHISFFWGSFHSLSSPTLGVCFGEGFYLPDPCELTFANTLLLSNAAVSLGGAFVSLENFITIFDFLFLILF
eukprot:UN3873